ncbi:MAG: hypothetical protein NZ807_02730, partial [Dehalococcoidia bacterium]|nr:hypothetical protein [Dehalococcoidia bacterium]
MPSTFSTNYGIELISTGEQAGLWGDTTNRNYQRFEQMAGGFATVTIDSPEGDLTSVWTPPTFKWITTDTAEAGELNSEGRCKFVSFTSIGDLGSDINVEVYGNSTADNPTRAFIVKNELLASRSITFKCGGSPSSTLAVPNGKSAYIYAKGNDIVNALGDVQVNTIDATTIESEVLDFSGAASSGDAQIKMPVGVSQALRFMDGATTMLNFDTSANKVISEVPFSCSSQIEGASGLFISAGDSTTQDLTVEGDLVVEGGFAGNFQIRDIQFVNDPDGTGIVGDGNEGVLGNPMDMVEHTFNFSTRIVVSRVLIIASCDIEADPNDDNQTFGSGPNQGT